ncbi:MAG: hypothetical protein WAN81_09520 [Candidatus Binataceae bacterium]
MPTGTQGTWKRLQSLCRRSAPPIFGLCDNINLAADMGAEVAWLKSPDVIKALIEFAQDKKITRIVVGQTHPGLWNRIFRRSLTSRLLSEPRDFDVEVVTQGGISTKS